MSFFGESEQDKLKREIEEVLNGYDFDFEKYISFHVGGFGSPDPAECKELDDEAYEIALEMEKGVPAKVLNSAWAWWHLNCCYIPIESELLARASLYGDQNAINKAKGSRGSPAYRKDLDMIILTMIKGNKKIRAKEVFKSLIGKKHESISDIEEGDNGKLDVTYATQDGQIKGQPITLKTIENDVARLKKKSL